MTTSIRNLLDEVTRQDEEREKMAAVVDSARELIHFSRVTQDGPVVAQKKYTNLRDALANLDADDAAIDNA